jgi:hypothetical protein
MSRQSCICSGSSYDVCENQIVNADNACCDNHPLKQRCFLCRGKTESLEEAHARMSRQLNSLISQYGMGDGRNTATRIMELQKQMYKLEWQMGQL